MAVGVDDAVYVTEGDGNHGVLKLAAGSAP
ncbi:Uncharacterised protein [Mycobacteroides abscessus subsp. abscessus]|nr:Uncharacterised protein [Mycobacteroides abscessus subsp. abscessus]